MARVFARTRGKRTGGETLTAALRGRSRISTDIFEVFQDFLPRAPVKQYEKKLEPFVRRRKEKKTKIAEKPIIITLYTVRAADSDNRSALPAESETVIDSGPLILLLLLICTHMGQVSFIVRNQSVGTYAYNNYRGPVISFNNCSHAETRGAVHLFLIFFFFCFSDLPFVRRASARGFRQTVNDRPSLIMLPFNNNTS